MSLCHSYSDIDVVLPQTSVTRMLHVTTPKDLTTALVKMDLKATAKTARVRFCLPPFSLIRDFRKQNTQHALYFYIMILLFK